MIFHDRSNAGDALAAALAELPAVSSSDGLVVLAVPRGGLPIGVRVAQILGAQFDVAVVRKLRSPHNPEMGFGAVGADGHVEMDDELVARLGLAEDTVAREVENRRRAVEWRLAMYRRLVPAVDLRGKVVVVVDDGIVTGGTVRQACALARRADPARVILAAPVAPESVAEELREWADEVIVLTTPPEFLSVAQAYQEFEQLDDERAMAALADMSPTARGASETIRSRT